MAKRAAPYAKRGKAKGLRSVAAEGGHRIWVDDETSARMARVGQKGTKPELIVRRMLSALGHRYRVENRDLPGAPDLANRSRGWAIFVHGCFWHRHRGCKKTTTPTRNRAFWLAKFERNVARDKRVVRQLRAGGFSVITVWECETVDVDRLGRRLQRLLG
jgi:DNA mismatch endonuclease (patch repair protein)